VSAPEVEEGPEEPTAASTRSAEVVKRDRRVELIAAILLSAATVITAWSAYQATRWSGEQAEGYTRASALRTESVRAFTVANRQIQIDVQTFIGWLDATVEGDQVLADDIQDRMREEFRPAFDAWLAEAPAGEIPPGTPFERDEYTLAAVEESDELEAKAAAAFEDGREANEIGDNFVLAAVLFASVLFFAGLAGTFDSRRAQVILLVLGGVVFAIGSVVVLLLPQNVAF
jgi:hypothetical protein